MTDQVIEDLFTIFDEPAWGAARGEPVDDADVRIVRSMAEAETVAKSRKLENLLLEHANIIREQLQPANRAAYREWNSYAIFARERAEILIARKLAVDALGERVPKVVVDSVGWIIVHAAIESAYAQLVSTQAYRSMVSWLTRGHLPLVWEGGIHPKGRLVAY
jgi:hypothetical protein